MAVYTVDEAQVDLLIVLAANYPLGGLVVQCNKQIGGTSHKQWLLQFKKCVLHQVNRYFENWLRLYVMKIQNMNKNNIFMNFYSY